MVRRASARNTAFTLIELLVVVSIIGLLVAILVPSLRSARETTKSAMCLHNLRQIGVCMLMYADENRGAIVHLIEQENEDAVHWIELLKNYIKTHSILRCSVDRSTDWEKDPFEPVEGKRTTSYVTNDQMTPRAKPPVDRLSQVKSPASKVFMAELKDDVVGDHFHPLSWSIFLSVPEDEIAMLRHAKQSNYWFVDGHVEKLTFDKTWKPDGTVNRYDPFKVH